MRQKSTVIRFMFILLIFICFASTLSQTYASEWHAFKGNRIPNFPPVQLFDIKAQRIIKTIPNSEALQAEAAKWLASVSGLSPQLTIEQPCGHIVRIPLFTVTPIALPKETLQVKDVFLIYCPDKEPLLLVLSKERKPYMLNFKADVKPFMKQILTLESTSG